MAAFRFQLGFFFLSVVLLFFSFPVFGCCFFLSRFCFCFSQLVWPRRRPVMPRLLWPGEDVLWSLSVLASPGHPGQRWRNVRRASPTRLATRIAPPAQRSLYWLIPSLSLSLSLSLLRRLVSYSLSVFVSLIIYDQGHQLIKSVCVCVCVSLNWYIRRILGARVCSYAIRLRYLLISTVVNMENHSYSVQCFNWCCTNLN